MVLCDKVLFPSLSLSSSLQSHIWEAVESPLPAVGSDEMYESKPRPNGVKPDEIKMKQRESQVGAKSAKHTEVSPRSSQSSVTQLDDDDNGLESQQPPVESPLPDLSKPISSEEEDIKEKDNTNVNKKGKMPMSDSESSTILEDEAQNGKVQVRCEEKEIQEDDSKSKDKSESKSETEEKEKDVTDKTQVVEPQTVPLVEPVEKSEEESVERGIGVEDQHDEALEEKQGTDSDEKQETELEEKQDVVAPQSKRRTWTQMLDDDEYPTTENSASDKKRKTERSESEKKQDAEPDDFEKRFSCWVEIPAKKRKKPDDDEEENNELDEVGENDETDEASPKKSTRAKEGKRAPLKERPSNVNVNAKSSSSSKKVATKPAKKGVKSAKKEIKPVKKEAKKKAKVEESSSSEKSLRRRTRQPERKSERKLTSRQSDLQNSVKPPMSRFKLVLPSKFERDCKVALQSCIDNEQKWMAADNVVMLLDLFQYFNDSSLTKESKTTRLTDLSRTLNQHVDDPSGMQNCLIFLQQKVMMWCASEDTTKSKSSGLDSEQAQKALDFMVKYVAEHGPDDRWEELRGLRDFKVNDLKKLRARFKRLISCIKDAFQNEDDLEP